MPHDAAEQIPANAPPVRRNFLGYILWSAWLVAFAALLWRRWDRVEDPAAPDHRQTAAGPLMGIRHRAAT